MKSIFSPVRDAGLKIRQLHYKECKHVFFAYRTIYQNEMREGVDEKWQQEAETYQLTAIIFFLLLKSGCIPIRIFFIGN